MSFTMSNIFDLFRKIASPQTEHAPITHMVVGLGNPGKEYLQTRHNIGFIALDFLANKLGATINRSKFSALYGEVTLGAHRLLFLKPQTYMNKSGTAVRQAMDFYHISPENVLVLSDDISFDVGVLRIRRSGSSGGQKGLQDIINTLGTDLFPRVKFGVGKKPHQDMELADWVISRFTTDEMTALNTRLMDLENMLTYWLGGKLDDAMNQYNRM